MSRDGLGLIQFFKVLLFLIGQNFAVGSDCLVDSLNAAKADDGARNSFVDPCKSHVGHGPVPLLRDLLNSLDDGQVRLHRSMASGLTLLLGLAAGGGAEVLGWSG